MEDDSHTVLHDLHKLANLTFTNVCNLAPAIRQVIASAKIYERSIQSTCNAAVSFINTLQNFANAASASAGATTKIGDVLTDLIETFQEVENMKLELATLFINEMIIPLEQRAEIQIGNVKTTYKSYNEENKSQKEVYKKAQSSYDKIRKRVQKKTEGPPKLDAKAKQYARTLDIELSRLKKAREDGLRKALIEERRVYCFITERMCAFGRGTIAYSNRVSNFLNDKISDWSHVISTPTTLPPESEDIIQNPSKYKIGTIKKKYKKKKKERLSRSTSVPNYYTTKYSTLDGRSTSWSSLKRPNSCDVSHKLSSTYTSATSTITRNRLSPHDSRASTPEVIRKAGILNKVSQNVHPEDFNGSTKKVCSQSPSDPEGMREYITDILPKEEPIKEEDKEYFISNIKSSILAGTNVSLYVQSKFSKNLAPMKALYDHVAQDVSQLSFLKGDIIIPSCEPQSGWQYGKNKKTQDEGWFPFLYTGSLTLPRCLGTGHNLWEQRSGK